MLRFFYIALGGAFGALFRYGMSGLVYRSVSGSFPFGTLVVNLIGALIIGLLWGLFEIANVSQNLRLFLFIGILGSFTTFSTFSLESFHLFRDGEYGMFIGNIVLNVVLSISLVCAGYFFSKAALDIVQ